MAKKIYVATHEGLEVTRTTDREYTHMVALYYKHSDGTMHLGNMGFCGRLDLAQKLLSKEISEQVAGHRQAGTLLILPAKLKEKKGK